MRVENLRWIGNFLFALILSCFLVIPAQSSPDSAASIEYQLPVAAAQVKLDLVLQTCVPVSAKATVTVTPVVRPSPFKDHYLQIRGSDLKSFFKKYDVKIELYPNGSIKSMNGGAADRTGAILGSVIKLASTLTLESQNLSLQTAGCNSETDRARQSAADLKESIKKLQGRLISGVPDPVVIRKQIDALAVEVGRIETEFLSISLSSTVEFWEGTKPVTSQQGEGVQAEKVQAGVIQWKQAQLKKWLTQSTDQDGINNFSLGWCVQESDIAGKEATCNGDIINGFKSRKTIQRAATVACITGKENCKKTIVFREPVNAVLTVVALGSDLGVERDHAFAPVVFPMPQWGEITYFPLKAGFAQSKNLALGLDEFGRRTSFGWSSGARGEEIFGSVQGIVEGAAAYGTAKAAEDLKFMKGEVEELETQQKLNKLRKCQAVLDAGGFVCPDQ